MKIKALEHIWKIDSILLGAILILVSLGLLIIYSIDFSATQTTLGHFYKQILALIIGLSFMTVLFFIDFRQIQTASIFIYLFGILLLIGVLFFGLTIRGTTGWFRIGGISFQPVELVKVAFAIFLASYFAKHIHKKMNWIIFSGSFIAMLIYVALILMQPDFGSAMIIVVMWGTAVALAGLPWKAWLSILFAGVLIMGLSWNLLQPYQKARITSFLNPEADPLGSGYNVIQAKTAIGSGGIWGKGIGEGSQTHLRFLPEASTDFIFAVIGEELGFIGVFFVIILLGVILIRIIWIVYQSNNVFASIYSIMIVGMLGTHTLINIGMNMGLMPVTGIPLPFASAAASSLISNFIAIGIIQNIKSHLK